MGTNYVRVFVRRIGEKGALWRKKEIAKCN
jgi:hypothetical protein